MDRERHETRKIRQALIAACTALALAGLPRAALSSDRQTDTWWSLLPLSSPAVPTLTAEERARARTPVDAFVLARQRELGLSLSPEAKRRTLIRRLHFDLLGLPPSPAEIERFVRDPGDDAYERLVDRLLASPKLGERWARHWLDVVHYADTHGYDKDKLRPNAWPYRDYVIRALNEDRPYSRFVREQLAGDVYFPGTRDGIVATGFIAAGPWDFIGHAEVPETKIDGKIARHLDRDDMVRTTMQSFASTTVGCARCHDHKFDPVSMEDYYSLQAVFAALDRADREFDPEPDSARRRAELTARDGELSSERAAIREDIRRRGGEQLAKLDARLAALSKEDPSRRTAAFGFHSRIEPSPDKHKWVQVDLGTEHAIARVSWVGCHDDFAGIGAGFGFPVRYRIDASSDERFERDVTAFVDETRSDVPNPGVTPQSRELEEPVKARYVRFTATRLVERQGDFILALAELMVLTPDGINVARDAKVSALDSVGEGARWSRKNLVDGYYYGVQPNAANDATTVSIRNERDALLARLTPPGTSARLETIDRELAQVKSELAALPARGRVYAGTIHSGSGAFRGTGHDGGKPRVIHVLKRGQITEPLEQVGPGAIAIASGLPHRFELPPDHPEGERRRALAEWVVAKENPLTWRSIVNRLWQYHFGRGLVDSPNDFGRMGQTPTHPLLLDWLAREFRDGRQSFKDLHRLILTSAVYRQRSTTREDFAAIDSGNRSLWRMNRRRLEAEAIRDSVLAVSDRLDERMGGPGFWCFVLEHPEHSPHYEYHKADPDDPKTWRRSVYRFIVRSQPDPFMNTLDCADSSLLVAKRNETLTPLQALTLLNNPFMLRMARYFAARLEREADAASLESRIELGFEVALGRAASALEIETLATYGRTFGLESACRLILNLNEFVFVD